MLILPGTNIHGEATFINLRYAAVDDEDIRFCENEDIYLVKPTGPRSFHVERIVGQIEVKEDGRIAFVFNDPAFKALIGYNEESGYSTLDGAAWTNERGCIVDFMFSCARNPFLSVPISSLARVAAAVAVPSSRDRFFSPPPATGGASVLPPSADETYRPT